MAGSYDGVKYNWKVSASPESFSKRNDRYSFEKLSKLRSPLDRLIASVCADDDFYVRDVVSSVGETWERGFAREISRLPFSVEDVLLENPKKVLLSYVGRKISLPTIVAYDSLTERSVTAKNWSTDPILHSASEKIGRAAPLVSRYFSVKKLAASVLKELERAS